MFKASRSLFLVGMMGSGKTTTGKQLAGLLGWPFSDLDRFIEEHEGRKISEIFENQGEVGFREREQIALKMLLELPAPRVVACGGGTPCFYDNMARIKQAGWVIYLETPVWLLLARLQKRGAGGRPLLSGGEPPLILSRLLEERAACYRQAHIVYTQNADGLPVAQELFDQFLQIEGH